MYFIIFLCKVLPDSFVFNYQKCSLLLRKKVIIIKNISLPQRLLTFCSFKLLKYTSVIDNCNVGSYSDTFDEFYKIFFK
jgi:hypothetical protein